MTETDLMLTVRRTAEPHFSTAPEVPPAFWAALTANESGGNPDASHFEPNVYAHLWAIAAGDRRAFGRLTTAVLTTEVKGLDFHALHLTQAFASRHGEALANATSDETLRALATAWGFTQLMGYHALEWGPDSFDALRDPARHFPFAALLLRQFCSLYRLAIDNAEALFNCWSAGCLSGEPVERDYVSKGLHRMRLWESLVQEEIS